VGEKVLWWFKQESLKGISSTPKEKESATEIGKKKSFTTGGESIRKEARTGQPNQHGLGGGEEASATKGEGVASQRRKRGSCPPKAKKRAPESAGRGGRKKHDILGGEKIP